MKPHQRNLLLASLGLLLTAFILLTSNRWIKLPRQTEYNQGAATKVWQTFPTRAPDETSPPPAIEYYKVIQSAILYQDFSTAEMTIADAQEIYPDDAYITQSEARLALIQGNYSKAEDLIWETIGIDPTNAKNWALAATILTQNEKPELAAQALYTALQLNPDLAPHMFQERWALAIRHEDTQMITDLADDYYIINPTDPMADYYNATALLVSGHINIAIMALC